jgi:hypothetical protein
MIVGHRPTTPGLYPAGSSKMLEPKQCKPAYPYHLAG